MATGLSPEAIMSIVRAEIDMSYVSMFGTWHIKVRGEQVTSSTLCYEGVKYVTYSMEDDWTNLNELSMERPNIKIHAN